MKLKQIRGFGNIQYSDLPSHPTVRTLLRWVTSQGEVRQVPKAKSTERKILIPTVAYQHLSYFELFCVRSNAGICHCTHLETDRGFCKGGGAIERVWLS